MRFFRDHDRYERICGSIDAGHTIRKIGQERTRMVWSRDGSRLMQLRRAGDRIELWEAAPGIWEWSRRAVLDFGRPAASHLEHMPLTVDPRNGELIMNRRSTMSGVLVLEGVDAERG